MTSAQPEPQQENENENEQDAVYDEAEEQLVAERLQALGYIE
jgi:hypothetical protein